MIKMRDIKWAVLGTGGIANEIKKLYKQVLEE